MLPQPRQDRLPAALLVRTKLETLKPMLVVSLQGFELRWQYHFQSRMSGCRRGVSGDSARACVLVCSKDDLKTRQPLSRSIESWSVVLLMSDSRRKACWYPDITKLPGPEPEPVRYWRPEHLANPATCVSHIDTLRKPDPDGVDLLEQR